MNIPAVQHHAGYPDVYLASRKKLVVTIHAAAGDIRTCELLIFPRTSPEKISSYLMQRVTRDGVRDHFTAEVITEDTLRYLKYYFRLTDTAGKIYFRMHGKPVKTNQKMDFMNSSMRMKLMF